MSSLEAILLGLIQGLTEFLPVSSSGHIELGKAILGVAPKDPLLFSVVVHFATALSTIVVFRKDISALLKGLFTPGDKEAFTFSAKIVLSMIPAALVGVLFNDALEVLFEGQVILVGAMLIITAVLLYVADRVKDTQKTVGFGHALIIGLAQAVAILPGISRSGATIATSVLLGIERGKAARFSFLMVVPLILGKMAKDLLGGDIQPEAGGWMPMVLGFVAAFVTGIIACNWMIALVRKSQLKYFAVYCLLVGITAIAINLFA